MTRSHKQRCGSDVKRTWVSWSSGKDSTFALRPALDDPQLEVTGC